MHASTASACLRKLSDWVNSVSKHHASARSIPRFSSILAAILSSPLSTRSATFSVLSIVILNLLDSSREIVHSIAISSWCPLWHSPTCMATTLAPVDSREVVRCDDCHLVQFRTDNNLCRRCRTSLDEDEPEPILAPCCAAGGSGRVRSLGSPGGEGDSQLCGCATA